MVIACELCGERRAIPMDWSKKAKTCLGCRPEWERRRMQAWRAANPERVRAQDRRRMANPAYRARKRAFMRVRYEMETGICRDPAIRTQVYMQAAGVCALCDSVVPYDGMTLDHVVPLARGGLDEIDNLQLAHFSCNARKGATV
jgi:5-methylcytosine-specific restriction endonuclease McrA